jgi:CHAD domain-containing protein
MKQAPELLAAAFSQNWTNYRVQLRRCQKKPGTSAIHDLRTSIRRLIAALELSEDILGARHPQIEKARKVLKKEIHSLSGLRDYQVQRHELKELEKRDGQKSRNRSGEKRGLKVILKFLEKKIQTETRKVSPALRDQDKKIHRRLHQKLHKKLDERLLCLHYDLTERLCKKNRSDESLDRQIENTSYQRLLTLHQHLKAAVKKARAQDLSTVHRVRIEFKKFRYGWEVMAPVLLASVKEPRGLNERLSNFQFLLGDIQDHEAMIEMLERFLTEEGSRSAKRAVEEAHRLMAWHGLQKNQLVEKLLEKITSSLEEFKPVRKLHSA